MLHKMTALGLFGGLGLTLGLGLTGCAGWSKPATPLAQSTVERLAKLPYPERALHGDDLDIVLVREGDLLVVFNREPAPVRHMQLWLNQQWVRQIDRLPVGKSVWELSAFINRFEEPYPTGTFLAPDKSLELLIGEFYDPKKQNVHRLLMQPDEPTTLPI